MATHRGLKPPGYKTTPDKSGSTPRATKFAIALGKDLFVTPIQGLYDYIASTSILVAGNAASVEMAMDGYHEHDFMDYFPCSRSMGASGS